MPPPNTPPPPRQVVNYNAHRFTMKHYSDWNDASMYVLAGPFEDGIQHNIMVQIDAEPPTASLSEYVAIQTDDLETMLKGCRILKKDAIKLYCGIPAARIIYKWQPSDELSLVQDQIYVLHNNCAYQITATFTKKSRQKIGSEVEKMMLSFIPK
jgi:hypothetical protein